MKNASSLPVQRQQQPGRGQQRYQPSLIDEE
jgi:hypothetical protein